MKYVVSSRTHKSIASQKKQIDFLYIKCLFVELRVRGSTSTNRWKWNEKLLPGGNCFPFPFFFLLLIWYEENSEGRKKILLKMKMIDFHGNFLHFLNFRNFSKMKMEEGRLIKRGKSKLMFYLQVHITSNYVSHPIRITSDVKMWKSIHSSVSGKWLRVRMMKNLHEKVITNNFTIHTQWLWYKDDFYYFLPPLLQVFFCRQYTKKFLLSFSPRFSRVSWEREFSTLKKHSKKTLRGWKTLCHVKEIKFKRWQTIKSLKIINN